MLRIRTLLLATAILLAAGCGATPTAAPDGPAFSGGTAPTDTTTTTTTTSTCDTCEDGGGVGSAGG